MALRDQLTLSLFDDTSLLGLTAAAPAAVRPILDPPAPEDPAEHLPVDYRLCGERRLPPTWRERAADNLAAIALVQGIEAEDRPATAEELTTHAQGSPDDLNYTEPAAGCTASVRRLPGDRPHRVLSEPGTRESRRVAPAALSRWRERRPADGGRPSRRRTRC